MLVKNDTKANHFIQPMGNDGRMSKMYGLRFCPVCLKEDEIPFFRKTWRLTFSTACVKHRCFLMDRCQQCGFSVSLFRRFRDQPFGHCYKCGAEYKNAAPEMVPADSHGLDAIRQLNMILDSGVFIFPGGYTYSLSFFDTLYKIIKLACFWKKHKSFFNPKEKIIYKKLSIKDPISHRYLVDYPLKMQFILFSSAMDLFNDLPDQLVEFISANNMRMSDIVHDLPYVPFWFLLIAERFNLGERRIDIEEVKHVIEYLKTKSQRVHKQLVADYLGIHNINFIRRPDLRRLFRKKGRFYLAA
jgi:TniQ